MKQKLEFPLFYLFWVAVCMFLIISLGGVSQVVVLSVGTAMFVSVLAYAGVTSCKDDLIYALHRPVKFMLLLSVFGHLLLGRSITGVLFTLIVALVILRVEGGYKYGDSYES